MTETTHAKKIHLGREGFLVNVDEWNEDVARTIAEREGLKDLSGKKMEIVRFMRDYYKKYQAFPILNYVCKNLDQPRECVTDEFSNPMIAWKIAGLPEPTNIHFVSFDGEHFQLEECC